MKKPWFKLGSYDPGLLQQIVEALTAQETVWRRKVQQANALRWADEREQWIALDTAPPSYVQGSMPWLFDRTDAELARLAQPSFNLVKTAADTLVSWLFTNVNPITVSSNNGRYEDQRLIKERSLALDAAMNTPLAEAAIKAMSREGALMGLAGIWPRVIRDEITFQPVRLEQLRWDPYEARDGMPRAMHFVETIDRDVFMAWYSGLSEIPRHKRRMEDIELLDPVQGRHWLHFECYSPYDWELHQAKIRSQANSLTVVHSYCTATAQGADDGRYACTVFGGGAKPSSIDSRGAVVAVHGRFPRITHPWVLWSPYLASQGLRGTGVGHLLLPWQEKLDASISKIQSNLERYGDLRVLWNGKDEAQLNAIATPGVTIIPVGQRSDAPQVIQYEVIPKEDLEWVKFILQNARTFYGINDLMAEGGSQLGAGASGAAKIEERSNTLDRMSDIRRAHSTWRIALGGEVLNAIEDGIQASAKFAARYQGSSGEWLTRPWSELVATNANYKLYIDETGPLSATRAGQVAKITEYFDRGLIPVEQAQAALLGDPDYRRVTKRSLSLHLLVEKHLEILRDPDGTWMDAVPIKGMDMTLASRLVQTEIELAMVEGASQETLMRYQAYKAHCDAIFEEEQAQANATMAGPQESVMGLALPSQPV